MELLCIQTHSQRAVIAGNIYLFVSDKCPCKCDKIDVGLDFTKSPTFFGLPTQECLTCGWIGKEDNIWWVSRSLFAQIATEDEVKESEQSKQEVLL